MRLSDYKDQLRTLVSNFNNGAGNLEDSDRIKDSDEKSTWFWVQAFPNVSPAVHFEIQECGEEFVLVFHNELHGNSWAKCKYLEKLEKCPDLKNKLKRHFVDEEGLHARFEEMSKEVLGLIKEMPECYPILIEKRESCCAEQSKECDEQVSIICGVSFFDLVSTGCNSNTTHKNVQPLAIPNYQREYCWRKKQVEGLLDSIWKFPSYGGGCLHLGTIVVHEEESVQDKQKRWNIVDGQQRAITLSILYYKLYKDVIDYKEKIDFPLLNIKINDAIPRSMVKHVIWSAKTIKSWIGNHNSLPDDFDIRKKISVDVVVIRRKENIGLAYTFFNAVNSAGKKLTDYDLLKTHHLRWLQDHEPKEWLASTWDEFVQQKVKGFDEQEEDLLPAVLDSVLYRIRMWSHARYVTTKGHYLYEHYLSHGTLLGKNMPRVDMALLSGPVGGSSFFDYVQKMSSLYYQFVQTPAVCELLKFPSRHDQLRRIVRALLFLYYCKFGNKYLDDAIVYVLERIGKIRNDTSISERVYNHPLVMHTVMALEESVGPELFFQYCVMPTNGYKKDVGDDPAKKRVKPLFWWAVYALYEGLEGRVAFTEKFRRLKEELCKILNPQTQKGVK